MRSFIYGEAGEMTQKEVWRIRKMIQRLVPLEDKYCEICGRCYELHRHHRNEDITDNRIENIAVICKFCHHKIHSRVQPVRIRQWAMVQ